MEINFLAIDDPGSDRRWQALFQRFWPAYEKWWLSEGIEARPTYWECRKALLAYMPEMIPLWERLVDLAGGGDKAARFLSLYRPPPYLSGCSQAVWPGEEPLLVRNYDYSSLAFEGVIFHSRWLGRGVMGMSDCLIGLIDGVNEAGLCVSLTFGGRRVIGDGFGVPIILRYLLEICETTEQAARLVARVPVHMAYNLTLLDAAGERATVYLSPDRPASVSNSGLATNHQEKVEWHQHARATASVERERFLLHRLTLHEEPEEDFIAAFLRPPLYSLAHDRGFGTLYSAAYRPRQGRLTLLWPGLSWDLDLTGFQEGTRRIVYTTPQNLMHSHNIR